MAGAAIVASPAYHGDVTRFRRGDETPLEDEREALRRQRAEGATEIESLKRLLAERVEFVRLRERELEEALGRLGRAPAARPNVSQPRPGPTNPALAAERQALQARAAELARREAALAEQERVLAEAPPPVSPETLTERERAVTQREADVERRLAELREQDPAEREARIAARLAELKAAELQFVKTQAELAARSDGLAEREQELAARERALPGGNGGDTAERISIVDVEAIEARLRRLEQSGARRGTSFSDGVRAMQERGTKPRKDPDAPLH